MDPMYIETLYIIISRVICSHMGLLYIVGFVFFPRVLVLHIDFWPHVSSGFLIWICTCVNKGTAETFNVNWEPEEKYEGVINII